MTCICGVTLDYWIHPSLCIYCMGKEQYESEKCAIINSIKCARENAIKDIPYSHFYIRWRLPVELIEIPESTDDISYYKVIFQKNYSIEYLNIHTSFVHKYNRVIENFINKIYILFLFQKYWGNFIEKAIVKNILNFLYR